MLNVLFVVTIILFTISSTTHGYDPLDPSGQITIKWDLLTSKPGKHHAQVTIENKQEYRHVEKPGWRLSWHWKNKNVIWDMRGAETTEQGNCSAFASNDFLPHCCLQRPTIVDLLPGAPYNLQISNCCRGGVLTSMSQNYANHISAFTIDIGSFPEESLGFEIPYNFDIGVPGYTCGNATSVAATKYTADKGRRKTQALATWKAVCMYSQFRSSPSPKCCVSLSAFYDHTVVPCPTCSCGCSASNCVKRGEMPPYIEQKHDPEEEVSPVVQCTNHLCPIRIHWHVKVNYREYWRVKITATNYNMMKNYSEWNLVVRHPNLKSVQQVFSFNYKYLTPYHNSMINDTGIFWGVQFYNDVLLQAGEVGNVQSELLLKKDMGNFTFKEGWAFPRRILFNGDDCVMPSPDDFPRLPKSAVSFSSSSSSAGVSFGTFAFCFLLLLLMLV